MKVPYSMDESEPDLYGGMGGYQSDDDQWETQTKWDCEDRSDQPQRNNVRLENIEIPVWFTQDQMTAVIQSNIIEREKLELKLLYARELLTELYHRAETLPYGYSQKIREYLTQ